MRVQRYSLMFASREWYSNLGLPLLDVVSTVCSVLCTIACEKLQAARAGFEPASRLMVYSTSYQSSLAWSCWNKKGLCRLMRQTGKQLFTCHPDSRTNPNILLRNKTGHGLNWNDYKFLAQFEKLPDSAQSLLWSGIYLMNVPVNWTESPLLTKVLLVQDFPTNTSSACQDFKSRHAKRVAMCW